MFAKILAFLSAHAPKFGVAGGAALIASDAHAANVDPSHIASITGATLILLAALYPKLSKLIAVVTKTHATDALARRQEIQERETKAITASLGRLTNLIETGLDVRSQMESLESKIDTLQGSVASVERTLRGDMSRLTRHVQELDGKIASVVDRVQKLEAA